MGKRKYENETNSASREVSKDEAFEENNSESIEQSAENAETQSKPKRFRNAGGFDIKHFRKELASKQGQTMVLTQFLQVCLNPDNNIDYLLDYLKAGGNSHEILRQISQESKKNLTLTTPAFHLFHLIILKVQSSLPHMITITEEACRYFLNNFMSTVEIMISENSGPRHRKIILKLLTSMVTLNPDLGVEVLSHAPLTPKHLQHILEKTNYKEKDNVRTSFVHFMTSFLVDGHLPLIKALLEKQGLLALVIPGLVHDEGEAVLMFLNILKNNVVENTFISKSLKLKTFSHQVLHNIFKIFTWKGPPDVSLDIRNELRPEIMSLLSDIVVTLFTSHRLGLYFIDKTLGTTDVNKNQNLYKALLTLKRPWENENECKALLEIVHKCPDLHRAVMSVVEQSFEPQHSPIWEKTTNFVIKLLDKMKPENVVPRMKNLNTAQAANFVRFVTLPVPLLKFIQTNLSKDQTISLYCVRVLVKMLQTLKRYMQILEMEDDSGRIIDLKNKLEYFLPKHLPAPTAIVALIQDVISFKVTAEDKAQDYKLPKLPETDALIYLIDVLLLYNDTHPVFFELLEGNIDMKQILEHSATLKDENTALLKFKLVSLWLTLDRSAISLKNPMFKDLFLIMLEVYTSNTDNTWLEAKSTLHNFLKNTAIFEADEDEIHLVLYSLRNSNVTPISMIADIFEYVLTNIKDLTTYVRNQIVNFEISDEDSQACLNKLFEDLMENRNTEDSVFLENKVPSTFIVGCMQFIQTNKEAKKTMKNFLSLYIANLFHCNYSPELTELLIGDSKLDVRSYVGQWVSQPASLPENITDQDNTFKSISKSIIDDEDISLNEIFPCLKESLAEEESDISVNGVSYKVNLTATIDSSELLVWAKYIIFCTIRLTSIGQLDETTSMKINHYFNCLVIIGKKLHLINECRLIMLSLFKNPHFLKLYKILSVKENDSDLLATKSLLEVINLHNDIVSYLDKKHRILKSYQQKNYNELVKALIKVNKRKTVSSDHTVKVLEVVGMTNEDDLLIFNKIFAVDPSNCIKEDKEPSLVLDILRTLLKKYSESIEKETPEHVIRKSMKLYMELLINKEVCANLTNLEEALVGYFENKPHHTGYVNDEIFKKFFSATTIRKSTSKLSSVLLKYNMKFCNIFKEQMRQPEILGQRELALPLGNAVVHHKQFLIENKELLAKIYEEYKSNINKVLEKPHKAGQIYNTCWEFIRKLIYECMDVEECQKLFSKSHKFEVAEISHFNLFQAVFLKICVNNGHLNKEYLMNYFLSVLHIINIALKDNKEDIILDTILRNLYNVTLVCKSQGFEFSEKEEIKKIIESAVWQNFCKSVLKDSLKVRTVSQGSTPGPQLLFLLSTLVKLFYHPDSEHIVTLFDMVTSHSEFLNVMLSHHSSDIKSRLLEFLYTLMQLNKSVMKSQQIPVYLSAYHATRSQCDRTILAILHFYESNGQPVNEYKPYVFGDSAANHYAVRKSRTSSLWGHPTANRILSLFDREIIDRTVRNFPVMQRSVYHYELPPNIGVGCGSLRGTLVGACKEGVFKAKVAKDSEAAVNSLLAKVSFGGILETSPEVVAVSHLQGSEDVYDPLFVLPLLGHLLAPGSAASCFKLLRAGLLSLPLAALSSHCPLVRASAYHVLHRFCLLLETETRHKNDKLFLTDFISTLRRSLSTAIESSPIDEESKPLSSPRLPAVGAVYLSRALMASTAPFDPLYKPVNNFFIAKQQVDLTVVPDFLSLFHDGDVEAVERRLWILEVIRDGTKTMTDINVIFKTMCLKMVMDIYSSVLSDRKVKERILSVINSVVAVPRSFDILLEGYGLMSWLNAVVRQLGRDDKTLVKRLIELVESMIHSLGINSFARALSVAKNSNTGKLGEVKVNKDVENEILNVLYNLLIHTDGLDVVYVESYVRVYNLLSRRTVKCLSKKQILNLVAKSAVICKDNEIIKLLTKAIVANDGTVLKSNICQIGATQHKDGLLKELTDVVTTFIT